MPVSDPPARAPLAPSPYLLLAAATLFWSGNFVIGRAVRDGIDPVPLTFWRWALAFAVLAPFAAGTAWRHRRTIMRHGPILIALGVTGIGAFHLAVYVGLQQTTAINAGLLMSTGPMMIAALAWAAFGERPTAGALIGLTLSMIGAVAVVARGDPAVLWAMDVNLGDLWMFAAALIWAVYSVLLKRRPEALPPMSLLIVSVAIGLVVIAPLHLATVGPGLGFTPSWETVGAILYVCVFASVIAYICWNRGVREVGPSRAGVFMHLMPLFSALLAMIFLGERLALYHVIGGVLIFAGIVLAARRPRTAEAEQAR